MKKSSQEVPVTHCNVSGGEYWKSSEILSSGCVQAFCVAILEFQR